MASVSVPESRREHVEGRIAAVMVCTITRGTSSFLYRSLTFDNIIGMPELSQAKEQVR